MEFNSSIPATAGSGGTSADSDGTPAVGDSHSLLGISNDVWMQISIIAVLFVCLFWPNLRRLWDKTNPFYGEANWGHAICIPFVGVYYLYVNRERLLNPPPIPKPNALQRSLRVAAMWILALGLPLVLVHEVARELFDGVAAAVGICILAGVAVCLVAPKSQLVERADDHTAGWFGGAILFFGLALFGYAIYPGQNDFLKDFGMVVTLFGIVLILAGWGVMQTAWFPIAYLVCAIPWPGLMYSRIASPLQQLAARVAVWTMEMTRVESSSSGTKIFIQGHGGVMRTLNVAEACAGLRSLMTFVSVGAAVAFLSARPLWQKITITLSAIPIAIFCNVMRVSGQGLLDHYVSQQLSENFAHQFVGMIMLIPAFLLILLVGWVLDQIFMEEVDRRHMTAAPAVIRRATGQAQIMAVPAQRPAPIRKAPVSRTTTTVSNVAVAKAPTPATSPKPAMARPTATTPPPSIRLAQGRPKPNTAKPANDPKTPPRREAI